MQPQEAERVQRFLTVAEAQVKTKYPHSAKVSGNLFRESFCLLNKTPLLTGGDPCIQVYLHMAYPEFDLKT